MNHKNWMALAVSIGLSAGVSVAFAANTFQDANSSWAKPSINKAVNQDIMTGYSDGMFHPDAWVTREDFVQMAAKSIGLAPTQANIVPSFNSVSQNTAGFSSVDNQSWLSSYPSGVALPDNPVRRLEALTALAGALNKPLVSDDEATKILNKYQDATLVPTESRNAVATAIQYKLFAIDPKSGNNIIDPLRPATRAEVATMLEELHAKRDIAIIKDGQMVANAVPNGAGMTSSTSASSATTPNLTSSSTTSTTATSSGTTTTTASETTTNTTGTATAAGMGSNNTAATQTTTGTSAVSGSSDTTTQPMENTGVTEATQADANKQAAKIGYKSTPYRNSANTIPEFKPMSTLPEQRTVDAAVPLTLAPGTTFMGTVAKSLYSDFNHPGDPAMLILDHPVLDANGRVIAPAGSKVIGFVNSVLSRNATPSSKNAEIGLTFNGFITPTGQVIPISATVDNADGMLKAGEAQGIVYKPTRSVQALRREVNTSEGGDYGSKFGKASVLSEPMVSQVSPTPLYASDITPKDLLIGVGDRLQLRLDAAGPGTVVNNTLDTTTPTSKQ